MSGNLLLAFFGRLGMAYFFLALIMRLSTRAALPSRRSALRSLPSSTAFAPRDTSLDSRFSSLLILSLVFMAYFFLETVVFDIFELFFGSAM